MSQLQNIWNGTGFTADFVNSFSDFHFNWFTVGSLSGSSLTAEAFRRVLVYWAVDLLAQGLDKCFEEHQKLYFSRRSEYSMLSGSGTQENALLEFTPQKEAVKFFFQTLEEKHSLFFDALVERLEAELSRWE